MSDNIPDVSTHVARLVAAAPPLSDEQTTALRAALGGVHHTTDTPAPDFPGAA